MIYELTIDGYRLGIFPSEAEAIRRAGYLPKGSYTIREWARDGEFSTFGPSVNKLSQSIIDTKNGHIFMSGKNKLAKIQDDSLGSNANRQTRPNMVDASLLSDYIATLKNLLNFKDEQIREQQEQMRLLIDKFRKLFEQCNESTGRSKGKHLLS